MTQSSRRFAFLAQVMRMAVSSFVSCWRFARRSRFITPLSPSTFSQYDGSSNSCEPPWILLTQGIRCQEPKGQFLSQMYCNRFVTPYPMPPHPLPYRCSI